jgi:hypothetical protein
VTDLKWEDVSNYRGQKELFTGGFGHRVQEEMHANDILDNF